MKTITLIKKSTSYGLYHSNLESCFYAYIGENFGNVQASLLRVTMDPLVEYFRYGMDYQGECDCFDPINVTQREWL